MRIKLIVLGIGLFNTLSYGQKTSPVKLYCDKSKSTITYSMNHPIHSWTGVNKDITSIILMDAKKTLISKVAVSIKIASFDSKNANRDSHVMESTEALKYSVVSFSSDSIYQKEDSLFVLGVLNFHGVNNVISLKAKKRIIDKNIEIKGNFSIKMTQFQIEPPSLLGMATDDEIKIEFDIVY